MSRLEGDLVVVDKARNRVHIQLNSGGMKSPFDRVFTRYKVAKSEAGKIDRGKGNGLNIEYQPMCLTVNVTCQLTFIVHAHDHISASSDCVLHIICVA